MAPDATPTTPTPAPAAAPQVATPPPPDLSALTQGGAQMPQPGTIQDDQNRIQAANNSIQQDAAKSTAPPPPPKHATLLRMVEGLGVALSSSATALSTHGKEGGAEEVQQYYGQKQAQEQSAQRARDEAKNAKVQQDIMAMNAARDTLATHILFAKLPNELTESDLRVKSAQQALETGKLEQSKLRGEILASGFNPDDPTSVRNFQQQDVANVGSKALKPDDPVLVAIQKALADPNTPQAAVNSAWSNYKAAVNTTESGQKVKAEHQKTALTDQKIAQGQDLIARINAGKAKPSDPDVQEQLIAMSADPLGTDETRSAARNLLTQGTAAEAHKQQSAITLAEARYGGRPVPAIDEQGNLIWIKGADAEARHLAPAQGGVKAMSQLAQIGDIRSGSNILRQALLANKGAQFSPAQVAKLTVAMNEQDPSIARNEFKNLAAQKLTPYEQDLVTALGQMNERVLSIRNIAGMGQGSEQTRNAILATVPDITSGNTELAIKKLDAVDNLIDNLSRGIPGLNINRQIANPPQPSGKAVSLSAAMALPINKGKTEAQVRADIEAHGHKVSQ